MSRVQRLLRRNDSQFLNFYQPEVNVTLLTCICILDISNI